MTGSLRALASGWLAILFRCYPASFRDRFGGPLRLTYLDRLDAEHARRGAPGVAYYLVRATGQILRDGALERWAERRRQVASATLGANVRSVLRGFARRPGFSGAAVVTFALGVGATTAVFTVVDAILVRPLPYPAAQDLAVIGVSIPEFEGWGGLAWRVVQEVRDQATTVRVATVRFHDADLAPDASTPNAVRIPAAGVSGDFFDLLGARLAGRTFRPEEDASPQARVVILSDAIWRRRWGADPQLLGRSIEINGEPHRVVGILPPAFRPPEALNMARVELFVPATVPMAGRDWDNFGRGYFRLVGRLTPGSSADDAEAELRRIHDGIRQEVADAQRGSIVVFPLRELTLGDAGDTLLPLSGAVGLLLLIAGVNVVNLFLARATARRRELAVRAALGASRGDLLRQLVVEAMAVALLGAGLGIVIAATAVAGLKAWNPGDLPRVAEVAIDARTVGFALGVALAAGLAIGLVSGWRGWPSQGISALRESGPLATAARATGRVRDGLVLAQTAVAVTLLVAAGLLINSFVRLTSIDPGFAPEHVAVAEVLLGRRYATDAEAGMGFRQAILQAIDDHPRVTSASVSLGLPLDGFGGKGEMPFTIEVNPERELLVGGLNWVGPGYFRTMGIPLSPEGREFTDDDMASGGVVIVNRALASAFNGGGSLVGARIKMGPPDVPSPWQRIIGVVGNVRGGDLTAPQGPAIYYPDGAGVFGPPLYILARTEGSAIALVPALRRAVGAADPTAVVERAEPLTAHVSRSLTAPRFYTVLITSFAVSALLLAIVGIYGTLAYRVSQRTREMGIRLALGATPHHVRHMVVGRGMALALGGIIVGLALALSGGRLLNRFLFGVGPLDAPTYGIAAGVLVLAALAATVVPARRATRVDPVTALKAE